MTDPHGLHGPHALDAAIDAVGPERFETIEAFVPEAYDRLLALDLATPAYVDMIEQALDELNL